MSAAESSGPSYFSIWTWLVALLVIGIVGAFIPTTKTAALLLVFAAAVTKATLVVRHYMHLKSEAVLIYMIAGIPVLLAILMTLILVPDIVFGFGG